MKKESSRRAEFDTYIDFIESLHAKFGGTRFYDYHNAFSKKKKKKKKICHVLGA